MSGLLRSGERVELRSRTDGLLGHLEILKIGNSVDVQTRWEPAPGAVGTLTHGLLLQLAQACNDMAFAVMDSIEQRLAQLGLEITSETRVLALGEDFEGLVLILPQHTLSFRLRPGDVSYANPSRRT